jgi:hypothetical protein
MAIDFGGFTGLGFSLPGAVLKSSLIPDFDR